MLKLKESHSKIQPTTGRSDTKFEPAKPQKGHVKIEELSVSTQSSLKKSGKTTDATVHPVDENLVENNNKGPLNGKCNKDKLIVRVLNGKPGASILKGENPNGKVMKADNCRTSPEIDFKRNRVKFREQLKEVNVVENWKEYNIDVQNSGVKCQCRLF